MDPRDALDATIKLFRLKASELSKSSGIGGQMLSRYRNKHRDMNSLNVFDIVGAMPRDARDYFWECLQRDWDDSPQKQPSPSKKLKLTRIEKEKSSPSRDLVFLSDVDNSHSPHEDDAVGAQAELIDRLVSEVVRLRADVDEICMSLGSSPYSDDLSRKSKQVDRERANFGPQQNLDQKKAERTKRSSRRKSGDNQGQGDD